MHTNQNSKGLRSRKIYNNKHSIKKCVIVPSADPCHSVTKLYEWALEMSLQSVDLN